MINAYIQGSYVRLDGKLAGIQGESMSRTLRLNFSPEWGELTKRILWLDARGKQVVSQPLVASVDEVLENNGLVIPVKIPGEALQYDGKTVFIVEGADENGAISLSVMAEMTVNPNDFYGKNAINATEPTPTEMQQLQASIEEAIGVAAADKQAAQAEANRAAAAAGAAAKSEAAAEDAASAAKRYALAADGAADKAEAARQLAESYTNNPPVPGDDGNWQVWDGTKYVDTGKRYQGDPLTYEDLTDEQIKELQLGLGEAATNKDIIPEQSVAFKYNILFVNGAEDGLIEGDTYIINWKGVKYEAICYDSGANDENYIGNYQLIDPSAEGSNYPFCILAEQNSKLYGVTKETSTAETVKIRVQHKGALLAASGGGIFVAGGAKVDQIIQVSKVDGNGKPIEWKAVDMPKGLKTINNKKYGIVAADYVSPFTADMFKVAYNNGVGIQKAIDDAKAAGQTGITLAPGNYPLCYHGTADEESNPIINACGINFYGYGVKLYVIYEDVEGTNPYFTGTTPGLSYGSIIETDSDVCGFHLVGERRFRVDASTKYRASSYGISLVSTTNGNTIRDCLIECVSGDGIGAGQHMVQLAGWQNETFTSVEWDDTTQTYVESNYKYVSQSHGMSYIPDMTKPLMFRCATYFLYAVGPLTVRCFDSEGTHIGVVQFWQGEYFYLPENTASWRLELTREVYHETTAVESFSFWLGTGTYCGTKIINCESRLNQRGGMSNLPNDVLVKDCYIHDNGNARDGMVAYYDSTRFGIDIEDIWIHRITIEGTRITDSFHGFLFRCGSVVLKNSVFSGSSGVAVLSLNFCQDFYAEQCIFGGRVSFNGNAAPHGEKVAIGCTFKSTKPDELYVVGEDTEALETHLEKLQAQVDAFPMSLNKTGLVKHADFTSAEPMVDKVSGETYAAFNNKTLLFDEHGVYSEESGAHINCEDFELADNFTLEVVTYKSFGSGVFTAANAGTKFHNPYPTWGRYCSSLGNSMFTPSYTQIDKDGTLAALNNGNFWTDMGFKDIAHFVYRCEGDTVTCKLNGHDLYTADGAKETTLTRVTVGLLAIYMQSGNESRLQEIRYYDRALTDDEVSRSFTYQKQKYAGTAADSGNAALNAATATDLGGVMADPAEETDTQPVRIGADNKLYTAPGGSGGGEEWIAIIDHTVTADDETAGTTTWKVNTDVNGNTFACDKLVLRISSVLDADAYLVLQLLESSDASQTNYIWYDATSLKNGQNFLLTADGYAGPGFWKVTAQKNSGSNYQDDNITHSFSYNSKVKIPFTGVNLVTGAALKEGSVIKVYGRKATS